MSLNILIGIGGTGAKVVEAVLHCCAAGLGPKQLTVGLIDQDRSNGNLSRTQETLSALIDARAKWRTEGGQHFFPAGDLLRTEPDHPQRLIWTPHPSQNTNLSDALGHLGKDRPLLDLLFKADLSEQKMDLGLGYQGKAHVGSAAITAAVDQDDPTFWKEIFEAIDSQGGGTEVRLVLAGSVFGGTGAAGFPTIARLIRRRVGEDRKKFRLGGVLMLPYFRFGAPDDRLSTVARSEDLLPQTRGALRYYETLRKQEKVFDEVFLTGWGSYFDLGYHSPGTGAQRNPALVPELIASQAALRFFAPEHEPKGEVLVSARRDAAVLSWDDLPSPVLEDDTLPYRKLGQQLRFAAAWKHWWPIISKDAGTFQQRYRRYGWYRHYGLEQLDSSGAPLEQAITAMNGYVDRLIDWAGTIQAYATRTTEPLEFRLWDVQGLLGGEVNFANPTKPVSVKQRIDEVEFGGVSRTIVRARTASDRLTDAAWLLGRLSTGRPQEKEKGLGAIVAALHRLSATTDASSRGANE